MVHDYKLAEWMNKLLFVATGCDFVATGYDILHQWFIHLLLKFVSF